MENTLDHDAGVSNSYIQKVLVIGSSLVGCQTALELAEQGIAVILSAKAKDLEESFPSSANHVNAAALLEESRLNPEKVEMLFETEVVSCRGGVGSFEVVFNQNGTNVIRKVGAVVIAEDADRAANFDLLHLNPSPAVISISEIEVSESLKEKSRNKSVAFIAGMEKQVNAGMMARVMRNALDLHKERNSAVYILTQDVKVSQPGVEALYQETRGAGVIFFRFTNSRPSFCQTENGKIEISLADEIASELLTLNPDLIVVDEDIQTSEYQKRLAKIFRLDLDNLGFLQTENVRRFPMFSNRAGIFVAGSSRDAEMGGISDASVAALAAAKCLKKGSLSLSFAPKIHRGRCTVCLTCYRVCPHGAVIWDSRAVIMPAACQGCGICVAECPMNAITIDRVKTDKPLGSICKLLPDSGPQISEPAPEIVVFCCRRSAQSAMELAARSREIPPTIKIREIPCAGSIKIRNLLKAVSDGADIVAVIACHSGNCYSERGNQFALERMKTASLLMEEIGLKKDRLIFETVAANMGREFVAIMNEAVRRAVSLGPNPLKASADAKELIAG